MSYFFISYQHEIRDLVNELRNQLEKIGILSFADIDISVSDNWQQRIDLSIDGSIGLIVLVNMAMFNSHYVTYEWAYAMGKGKRVIPIYVEPITYDKLAEGVERTYSKLNSIQYYRLIERTDEQWAEIIRIIKEIYDLEYVADDVLQAERKLTSINQQERAMAVEYLREHLDQSSTNALARALKLKIPDTTVQAAMALAAKSNYKDERALEGLAPLFLHGIRVEYRLRNNAVTCLAQFKSDEAVHLWGKALIRAVTLDNLDRELTGNLWSHAGHFAQSNLIIPYFKELLAMDEAQIDKVAISQYLGKFEDPSCFEAINQYLQRLLDRMNTYREPIYKVIEAAISTRHPNTPEMFGSIYEKLHRRMPLAELLQHLSFFKGDLRKQAIDLVRIKAASHGDIPMLDQVINRINRQEAQAKDQN